MVVPASSSLRSVVGGENDPSAGDKACLYLIHAGAALGFEAEPHGSESGQSHAVAFGGPGLDDLACGIPAGLHHSAAHP